MNVDEFVASVDGGNRPPSVGALGSAEVIRRLELTVNRRLDGLLHGDYRGLVPGHGSEPGESRRYQAGDDVRRIDWNVTARTREPHVRDAIADRELETWALVDTSASLDFGTARCEKRDLALAVMAALGVLTGRGGNRMGALITSSPSRPSGVTVPARSGRVHLQALLGTVHASLVAPAPSPSSLADAAGRLGRIMKRRGLAVVVSDFLDPSAWEGPLRALGRRHETLAVELVDPRELELPNVGVLELLDPESGATLEVQTADPKVRQRFAEAARAQREATAAALRRAGVDHLVLTTDRDWVVELARFVAERRERADARSRVRT